MGLLENKLSLRTSAHTGVVPQGYFLRAQSPGFSNSLVIKPGCFHSTGGAATPVTSVYSSQRHAFLTAPFFYGQPPENDRYTFQGHHWSGTNSPWLSHPVSLYRPSSTAEAVPLPRRGRLGVSRRGYTYIQSFPLGRCVAQRKSFPLGKLAGRSPD